MYYVYSFDVSFTFTTGVVISNCNFSYNGGAKSLVYIEVLGVTLELINISFHDNKWVSNYVLKSDKLHINGQVILENNIAENGAAIYISDYSTVIFGNNSNVKFVNNSVSHNGASIFLNHHSTVIWSKSSNN